MSHALYRQAQIHQQPSSLSDIYQENVQLSVWQRQLESNIQQAAQAVVEQRSVLQLSSRVTVNNVERKLTDELGSQPLLTPLQQDIAHLVNLFCCLFNLSDVGLRLSILNDTMCPRFHVDRVPCRLITTYHGIATQWLPHHRVDRSKLGAGNQGLGDSASGIYQNPQHIESFKTGDVALLKGESWDGNVGGGIVHRSPQTIPNQKRLLMTLDF